MAINEPTSAEVNQALDKLFTLSPNNGVFRVAEPAILSSLQELGGSTSYDYSPKQDSSGGGGGGGGDTVTLPILGLQIASSSSTKVYITEGTVNSQYPTLNGTAINNATPPTLTISSKSWIWIKCVGVFGATDSYTITIVKTSTDAAPSEPAITTTGFTSCFLIGYVEVSGSAISSIVNDFSGGNLGVESFGSNNLWWAR